MITIRIDEIPQSNNKYIGRDAKWEYQEEKKRWAWMIKAASAKEKPNSPFETAEFGADKGTEIIIKAR